MLSNAMQTLLSPKQLSLMQPDRFGTTSGAPVVDGDFGLYPFSLG